MRQIFNSILASSEELVRDVRRATRKQYSAEERFRDVLDGLRGTTSIVGYAGARIGDRRFYTTSTKSLIFKDLLDWTDVTGAMSDSTSMGLALPPVWRQKLQCSTARCAIWRRGDASPSQIILPQLERHGG